MLENIPAFPYGAVYFRKSNPPQEDWAKDYKTAFEDGMNIFRHWFLWSAIEVEPGKYMWDDYDRQMDLAANYGMKTIIAEMITAAPEWAFTKYPHACFIKKDGLPVHSHISGSCVTGGFPGLCLDNEDVKELAANFLKKLVERYKDHPGLGGYDIWNECNYPPDVCYCKATKERFRQWLKNKYGDLRTLSKAWHRYSFTSWEDVQPPFRMEPYVECLDWLQFRKENAYALMKWRADIIRSLDPWHPITAHGIAASLTDMASSGADDWMAASNVDVYGCTWIAARKGNEPWKQWHAIDLVRSASGDKPFWHTEFQGGPLWMQPQVINRPREDGRIAWPEDIRLWNMTSFAAGARGVFYVRWRPLLDGPLFGAFGAYGMDGSRTPRSEMASKIAKWATDKRQERLWSAKPIKGDIGIIVVPESQAFNYVQQGNTQFYREDLWGVYRGFFDNNIQADWVHIDHIEKYDLLYLPYPVMLNNEHVARLKRWIMEGGMLISEGCPGYFSDDCRACTVQPGMGLDEVFGVRESNVEFTPDILDNLTFNVNEISPVYGGLFLQQYKLTSGRAIGYYESGGIAAVENHYGKGKTMIIGTFPGKGYWNYSSQASKEFFLNILSWSGKIQHVKSSCSDIKARIQRNADEMFLWVVNHSREESTALIELSPVFGPFEIVNILWGNGDAKADGNRISVVIEGRDALVLELKYRYQ